MIVIIPSDSIEAKKAVIAAAVNGKPTYIRLTREATSVMTTDETPFEIGKAEIFWESKDPQVTIIAAGPLLYEALIAAKKLKKVEIEAEVINCHTIKPIDERLIILAAKIRCNSNS
jgi:transketolase